MSARLRPRALVFIIFSLWTTGFLSAAALAIGAAGVIGLSEGQGFGPKLQWGAAGSLDFVLPVTRVLAFEPGFEYVYLAPSDVSGGFAYRGFQTGALSLMLQLRGVFSGSPGLGELSGGVSLGGAAAIAVYTGTTLYFFFPEARARAFLQWMPTTLAGIGFVLALPAKMQFRRDMTWSIATGLELDLVIPLGKSAQ
jgi:hypothetical protein